jgi:GH25 family lysozyme M1 (1,4-beta-N-acetylmuramidase)
LAFEVNADVRCVCENTIAHGVPCPEVGMESLNSWVALVLFGAVAGTGCAAPVDSGLGDSWDELTAAPRFDGDPANHAVFAVDISHWELASSEAEMDCFWDSGVRHVISGTQNEDITRQQLAVAVRRGMSVDAYVYLYWNGNTAAQVTEAFRRVRGFPIQRMWLDIEERPHGLGSREMIAQIQEALDTCRAEGTVECGFYTGSGFWYEGTGNTTLFSDVPLWFAHYDGRTSLSDWPTESFGGWTAPVAKQFSDGPLCGMAADENVMQVLAGPTVVVDRTPPPASAAPPPAPTGLYPYEGLVSLDVDVKLIADTVPLATRYEFALETWNRSAFRPYYTWSRVNPFAKVSLSSTPAVHRFRVRASTAAGWGEWSGWNTFDVGRYSGPRPAAAPPADPTPPPADPTPPPAPPPADPSPPPAPPPADPAPPPADPTPTGPDVPTGLAPDGVVVSGVSATLTFNPVAGATRYEIAIENGSGATFVPYYTYTTSAASKTFYPAVRSTSYRFRVRATVAGAARDWSPYATFDVP